MKHQGMNEEKGFPHTPICRGHAQETAPHPGSRQALQVSCLSTNPRATAISAKPRLSPER